MAKQKAGRTAPKAAQSVAGKGGKKKCGSIHMDAEIRIAGPKLLARLASGERVSLDLEPGPEFLVTITEGKNDEVVELRPRIDLTGADVKINAGADDFGDILSIYFEDGVGREFSVNLSSAQARVLIPILTDFAQAHNAWAKVQKGITVFGAMAQEA